MSVGGFNIKGYFYHEQTFLDRRLILIINLRNELEKKSFVRSDLFPKIRHQSNISLAFHFGWKSFLLFFQVPLSIGINTPHT